MAQAMVGAGCFWGVQAAFDELSGVRKTLVGYSGGTVKNPTYEQVCEDTTGHAEVVYIEYNEKKISYEKLLDVFFSEHDPTQLNKQGPDVGTQYRSAIFYYTDEQKNVASKFITELQKTLQKKIVTTIESAKTFYLAEEYHQDYFKKHGRVCHF